MIIQSMYIHAFIKLTTQNVETIKEKNIQEKQYKIQAKVITNKQTFTDKYIAHITHT